MRVALLRRLPLLPALLFAGILLERYFALLQATDGSFVYGLDDAYIHLSVARSLAEEGVWGLSPSAPSGASSSPLWTLLLSFLFLLDGPDPRWPLILNLALSGWVLARADQLLQPLPSAPRGLLLLTILLICPVPTLVFGGLEHVLHLALLLEFLVRWNTNSSAFPVLLLAPLLVAARYESLFLLTSSAIFLVEGGKSRRAIAMLGLGVLPVLAYGFWLLSHGFPFFPAGLMVKTALGQPTLLTRLLSFLIKATDNLYMSGPLLLLLAAGVAWLRSVGPSVQRDRVALMLPAAGLHILFSAFGHAFRYEAWLYLGLLTTLAPPFVGLLRNGLAASLPGAMGVLLLCLGLGQRALLAWVYIPIFSSDIYAQQVQMARFLAAWYPGEVVVANDVGAITFLGNSRVLDIAGLGTPEVLALRDPHLDRGFALGKLALEKGARIGIFYEEWFGEVPEAWTRVGRWRVPESRALGAEEVSFYAVYPADVEELRRAFQAFGEQLPARVEVLPDSP